MKIFTNIFTLANIITFPGILCTFIALPMIAEGLKNGYIHPTGVFFLILVFLSDFFDGIVARKMNQTSELGKVLDPVRDKFIMIWGAFVLFDFIFILLLAFAEFISFFYSWKIMKLKNKVYISRTSKWISGIQAFLALIFLLFMLYDSQLFVLLCSALIVFLSFWRMIHYFLCFYTFSR